MRSNKIQEKYIRYFTKQGYTQIPPVSLLPNDVRVQFTESATQQLDVYISSNYNPKNNKLFGLQRCFSIDQISKVGNKSTLTLTETLNSWTLGTNDIQSLARSNVKFLTNVLHLDSKKLKIVNKNQVAKLAYKTGSLNKDTIIGQVFVQEGNVGCELMLERINMVVNDFSDIYATDLFSPVIKVIKEKSGKVYDENSKTQKSERAIADHLRSVSLIILEGVEPSNYRQGYALRTLFRKVMINWARLTEVDLLRFLETPKTNLGIHYAVDCYRHIYPELHEPICFVHAYFDEEWKSFSKNLQSSYPTILKLLNKSGKIIRGKDAFLLYQTYGLLPLVLKEIIEGSNKKIDYEELELLINLHKKKSSITPPGIYYGGFMTKGPTETKYNTASYLLHQALRDVLDLGKRSIQKSCNITSERVRYDFSFPRKLTTEEIKQIDEVVNEQIRKDISIIEKRMTKQEALQLGAIPPFGEICIDDQALVYSIGDFSKQIGDPPHVTSTGALGKFKIMKEESVGAGVRRIYAVLEESHNYGE